MDDFKVVFLYSGYAACHSTVTPSGFVQNSLVDVSGEGRIFKTPEAAAAAIEKYKQRLRKGLELWS